METTERQAGNTVFVAQTAKLSTAVGLLEKAAEKLKQTFNVGKAAFLAVGGTEEEELPSAEQTSDMLGLSFLQTRQDEEQPPAPVDRVQKGGNIIAILVNLAHDTELEIKSLEKDEQAAQAEYETFMADAGRTKKARKAELTTKKSTLAKFRKQREGLGEDVVYASQKREGLEKEGVSLHDNCDFLLKNYAVRKEGRAGQVENLQRAIAILRGMKVGGGAGESLAQKSAEVRQLLRGGGATGEN